MHEVQGLFCKTRNLWINDKIAQRKKNIEAENMHWAETEQERWGFFLTMGYGPGRWERQAGLEASALGRGGGWALLALAGPADLARLVSLLDSAWIERGRAAPRLQRGRTPADGGDMADPAGEGGDQDRRGRIRPRGTHSRRRIRA